MVSTEKVKFTKVARLGHMFMTLNFSIITLQEFGSLKKKSEEEKETHTHTHTHTHTQNATHFNIFQGKNDIISHSLRGIGEDHTIIVKIKIRQTFM